MSDLMTHCHVHSCPGQLAARSTRVTHRGRPSHGQRRRPQPPSRLHAGGQELAPPEALAKPSPAEQGTGSKEEEGKDWVPVFKPEDLPKGTRREAKVLGVDVMLFWYKNSIRAIEARSPAEGAYSEGFMSSVFTQNNEIACPGTGTLFDLNTGEITEWYPSNPVLRLITPKDTCRNLRIFPVKMTQEAISVDVSSTDVADTAARGGAETSLESNNVFALQPRVYLEGEDPGGAVDLGDGPQGPTPEQLNPYTIAINVFAFACVGAAGTAGAIYYENNYLLVGLWVALGILGIRGLVGLTKKEE